MAETQLSHHRKAFHFPITNATSDFVFTILYLVQITTKSVITHKDRFLYTMFLYITRK